MSSITVSLANNKSCCVLSTHRASSGYIPYRVLTVVLESSGRCQHTLVDQWTVSGGGWEVLCTVRRCHKVESEFQVRLVDKLPPLCVEMPSTSLVSVSNQFETTSSRDPQWSLREGLPGVPPHL